MNTMTVTPLAGRDDRILDGVRQALEHARPRATELPWHLLRLSGKLPPGTSLGDLQRLAHAGRLTLRVTDEVAPFVYRGLAHGPWATRWFGLPT